MKAVTYKAQQPHGQARLNKRKEKTLTNQEDLGGMEGSPGESKTGKPDWGPN